MFKLFKRIIYLVKGKGHKLLDQFEKPEEQLAVVIDEMSTSIINLQKSVTTAVVDEKKLKMQLDDAITSACDWENKAVFALQQGDEELATEALLRKEDSEQQVTILTSSWRNQREAVAQLKHSLLATKRRVDETKRQYSILLARYHSAEAKNKITRGLSVEHDGSPMQFIEQLNDKILQIEAETEAQMEMIGDGVVRDVDMRFEELERSSQKAKLLADFKARVGAKTLGPGAVASPHATLIQPD